MDTTSGIDAGEIPADEFGWPSDIPLPPDFPPVTDDLFTYNEESTWVTGRTQMSQEELLQFYNLELSDWQSVFADETGNAQWVNGQRYFSYSKYDDGDDNGDTIQLSAGPPPS